MTAVRKEVQAIDPDQPVFNLRTMERAMQQQMWPYYVFGTLFTIFATIGLAKWAAARHNRLAAN